VKIVPMRQVTKDTFSPSIGLVDPNVMLMVMLMLSLVDLNGFHGNYKVSNLD
jgi:hypothetical protein